VATVPSGFSLIPVVMMMMMMMMIIIIIIIVNGHFINVCFAVVAYQLAYMPQYFVFWLVACILRVVCFASLVDGIHSYVECYCILFLAPLKQIKFTLYFTNEAPHMKVYGVTDV
jgi:hypothetical protein